MFRFNFSCFTFLVLLFFTISAYSQSGNSPYSVRGVGDVASPAQTHNIGMGEVGYSTPNNLYLNNMNPALLPYNTFTTFNLGILSDYKRIENNTKNISSLGGGLNYLTFAFPIKPGKWTLSSGILPYSVVNYNYQVKGIVPGTETPVEYDYRGEGGINQAFISNGFKFGKRFSAGFQIGYLFGSIINETGTGGTSFPSRTVVYDRTGFSDISLKGGLAMNNKVGKNDYLNVGVIYELESDVNAKHFVMLDRRTVTNATINSSDTLINNLKGSVHLPSTFGLGISLLRSYKWTIASDFTFQNWSSYRSFSGTEQDLKNRYKFALGGEFIPDAVSVDNYFKRMTYRAGLNYEITPFQVNDEQLKDFGINFGVSLPVRRLSSLDLAFKFGQRGTTNNDLLKENYFRVFLGVTFNDQWFVRRKYD